MARPTGKDGPKSERIQLMTTVDVADWIDSQSQDETRSQTVHRILAEMNEKENREAKFAVYTREIDYGAGVQTVYAKDGKIVKQFLGSASELHHSYTGDGNPEWVGQNISVIRGSGFKRLRNKFRTDEIETQWLEEDLEG